jgi:alpha-beta hydrolase superfamily lysophospholipase
VHGLRDHGSRYAEAAQTLTRAGVAVHALDLRGHGRSPGPRAYVESFADYHEDLARFVADVRAREPGAPLFLFGHSLGGAIVTSFVLARRPEIAGVVLSAAALRPGPDISPLLMRVTLRLGDRHPRWRVLRLKPKWFSRDPEVVRDNARTDPWIDRRPVPARTAAELLRTLTRIEAAMPELRVPLLILHGVADRITDPGGSQALHDRAGAPDRTLERYPGLYHDLLHEPERAAVLADISRWLLARAPAP